VHVFDFGLQFPLVQLVDPAAEYHGQLVGSADIAIGVEQSVPQFIQRGALAEDQVFAVLCLSKEQLVPATRLSPFFGLKEGNQPVDPFVPAPGEIVRRQRIGHLLQGRRIAALTEGIFALGKANAGLLHPEGKPVVLWRWAKIKVSPYPPTRRPARLRLWSRQIRVEKGK